VNKPRNTLRPLRKEKEKGIDQKGNDKRSPKHRREKGVGTKGGKTVVSPWANRNKGKKIGNGGKKGKGWFREISSQVEKKNKWMGPEDSPNARKGGKQGGEGKIGKRASAVGEKCRNARNQQCQVMRKVKGLLQLLWDKMGLGAVVGKTL